MIFHYFKFDKQERFRACDPFLHKKSPKYINFKQNILDKIFRQNVPFSWKTDTALLIRMRAWGGCVRKKKFQIKNQVVISKSRRFQTIPDISDKIEK